MGDKEYTPEPTFAIAAVTMQLQVSREWSANGGKQQLIKAIEELMGIGGSFVGPGGSILEGLFISVQPGRELTSVFEAMRKEYPLVPGKDPLLSKPPQGKLPDGVNLNTFGPEVSG